MLGIPDGEDENGFTLGISVEGDSLGTVEVGKTVGLPGEGDFVGKYVDQHVIGTSLY